MNSYFQFKKFKINQDKCAQKVSEIACILGAACPIPEDTNSILDIGAGTGLLSLMLAQRTQARIDAIEIEEQTFYQLNENIENSIFKNRIQPILHDATKYTFEKKYDLIICNPPFFTNSLKSKSISKNIAWHDETLTLTQLFTIAENTLKDTAQLHIVLPNNLIENQNLISLHINYRQKIKHRKETPPKYELIGLGKYPFEINIKSEMIIREGSDYTFEIKNLFSEFYLYL